MLVLKINGGYLLADAPAQIGNQDVFWMYRVSFEAGPILKYSHESGVERARQMQDVRSDGQALELRNLALKTAQQANVFVTHFALDICSIFPNDYMCKHVTKDETSSLYAP